MSDLKNILNKRQLEGNLRKLHTSRGLIDFCSNDYLGLARSSELKLKLENKLAQIGCELGSTGSRLVTGNCELAENLERKLARFHQSEAALLFNSGYDANLGLFSSVAGRHDSILYDELSHASVRDGVRLSLAKSHSFRHNDCEDLEKKLKVAKGDIYIAVESVYSMDGDLAPLEEISRMAQKYNANLIVDEAHATGIFGERGEGLVSQLGLQDQVFARVHTFGKALGCHGAIVAGSSLLKDYLINFARSFIYSTALPPHSLIAAECAYDFLEVAFNEDMNGQPGLHQRLVSNVELFASKAREIPGISAQSSAIQVMLVRGNSEVKKLAEILQSRGFDVRAILSPTVPEGKERLRICLHAFNSHQEIVDLTGLLSDFNARSV